MFVLHGFAPQLAGVTIDYPANGSVFPPEITSPTFLWRDSGDQASVWLIEVSFADRSGIIRVKSTGERLRAGNIDPQAVASSNEPPKLTPEQSESHTWKPESGTWAEIKRRSLGVSATVTISGLDGGRIVSKGQVTIQTSPDPVGAPVFYRDVPLMPNESDKGVIKPLPAEAVGLIQWRLRYIGEPASTVVMEKLGTCANCHSFSLDGKTMGLDVDGPQNDRGLYALIPIAKRMSIHTEDVIKWPAVRDSNIPRLRASFMSQVSPDGRYVLTTIDDPDARQRTDGRTLEDKYYNANFLDYRFLQVFYPTRGILAWYDRQTKRLQPLPGANDPRYVQTNGVWSPDGKWIVFIRADAISPYLPGAKLALFANDPNETQIRYDLYRIPFNEGRGGRPEPVAGASANGMSNSFPKVSPDGRWIVFVQCRNGLLMRPDSQLYIVPAAGGRARLMKCNTRLMNSWHTFSPNGRWLAFSSKGRSPYTQLYLTHIDAEGNDTPPIFVDNTTAANRAVNLPEFVNIPPGGMQRIDAPATEFYRRFDAATGLMKSKRYDEAIEEWRKAIEIDPNDAKARYNFAWTLMDKGRPAEAAAEYRKACDLNPDEPAWFARLALALAESGNLDDAVLNYRKSLRLNPDNPGAEADLGVALFEKGLPDEGSAHLEKAVTMAPEFADARNKYGILLAKTGKVDEAVKQLEAAVALLPDSVEYQFNLGYVMGLRGDFLAAIPPLEKAAQLGGAGDYRCAAALATAYYKAGRQADALQAIRKALDHAAAENNEQARQSLLKMLENYDRN
ncbi:MAG TPA: tetratricopeptide repeat protein [Bryobacteraceae bacterium]|nr:tetratricopeptide repeat protein [Bryobacteraceae bacterium]